MVANNKLKGVIPAIITPMDEEGRIDFALLEKQGAYLAAAGVDGFFIGGTTGEGAYLGTAEKIEVFRAVRNVIGRGQFLCAACIQASTPMVLAEMEAMAAVEPDYVVAVTPYYLAMRQMDILEHFRAVARRAPAPLILYNIPSNTHNPMALESVQALMGEANVAGLKDSTGDFVPFSRGLLGPRPDGFAWIMGEDYLDAAALMLGADGVVTGLGNARIEPYVQMVAAARRGDWQAVRGCQARINRLYALIRLCGSSAAGAKAGATVEGRASRWMRQKSLSVTDAQLEEARRILAEYDRQGTA